MALSDIYIPTPKEYDDSDSTGEAPISSLTGFGLTVEHDFQFGPTNELIGMLHDKVQPGRALSQDDYEKSEYKRPGVSFPDGVSEARAKRSADRYDANLAYQNKMDGLTNGILAGTGKFVGHTIGFFSDPVNLAATGAAVAAGGVLSEPLLAAAAEYGTIASLGAKFATDAFIAGASMAPQSAVDYSAGTIYGENPSMLSAASSLAINSGLGGLIGTVFHGKIFSALKRIIPSSEHFNALKAAVGQMAEGKKVDVSEILQNGINQEEMAARNVNAEFTPEEIADNHNAAKKSIIDDLQARKEQLSGMEGYDRLKMEIDKQLDYFKKDMPQEEMTLDMHDTPDEIRNEKLSPKQILDGDYDEAKIRGIDTEQKNFIKQSWNQLADNAAMMLKPEASKGPVTKAQVQGIAARLKSVESNNEYDPQEALQDEREVQAAKKETQIGELGDNNVELRDRGDIDDLKNQIGQIVDDLPDDLKEEFKNIDGIQEDHNKIADAIQSYADCILRG